MTIEAYIEPKVTRTLQPEHITVSLAEFDLEDVAEYLRANGYQVNGAYSAELLASARSQEACRSRMGDDDDADYVSGLLIDDGQLARVGMLALCGQKEAAREFVLQIVSEHLGRAL